MRVLVTGADGYLGWPLSLHLLERGHEVVGIDNLSRRRHVREAGSHSATPIGSPFERFMAVHKKFPDFEWQIMDLRDYAEIDHIIIKHAPDAIAHLGEIPSAPYSMIDREHCEKTMMNNINGTNNILFAMKDHASDAHLLKLGTMGEYLIPRDGVIPEAPVSEFPRAPGSYYHASKVADSVNVELACKIWGLKSTDVMQGVVHGIVTDEIIDDRFLTRFDFDEIWGTTLNRFCAQAVIGHKLTPYGKGGQTRGYISLRDSIQCMTIAIENPPKEGEYRILNQFSECYSVNELAERVVNVSSEFGIDAHIWNIENPRVETEKHRYNPDHNNLYELGFRPTNSLDDELRMTIPKLMEYKDRIQEKQERIMPTIKWRK